MSKEKIVVVKPKLVGLDDYMDKVRRMIDLLTEASNLYYQLGEAEVSIDYEVEPTRTS